MSERYKIEEVKPIRLRYSHTSTLYYIIDRLALSKNRLTGKGGLQIMSIFETREACESWIAQHEAHDDAK